MEKKCYICGKTITEGLPYYCVGPNSYVCMEGHCYTTYWWDALAAHYIADNKHEYFVANNRLYNIGSDKDDTLGFSGCEYKIEFFDGTTINTNSLWFIADIPEEKRSIFKENAKLITKG